ncbi:MAG: carboxypeptidase-like regulatory domain-containing protein [Pyrinomonadaceae bacterium]
MNILTNKLSALFLIAVLLTPVISFAQEKSTEAEDADQTEKFIASLAPTPILVSGSSNITCAQLRDMNLPGLGHMLDAWEFKIDSPPMGVNTFRLDGSDGGTVQNGPGNPNMSVTYNRTSSTTVSSWQIDAAPILALDRRISAVIIKGGNAGKNVYPYIPLASFDTGAFTTPGATQAISHISFCFERTLSPSAARVSVTGRVVANGHGVPRARVNLVDENGQTRSVVTSPFGHYRFDEVEVGQTYIISVFSKGHRFTSRLISINDELTDLDFVADDADK